MSSAHNSAKVPPTAVPMETAGHPASSIHVPVSGPAASAAAMGGSAAVSSAAPARNPVGADASSGIRNIPVQPGESSELRDVSYKSSSAHPSSSAGSSMPYSAAASSIPSSAAASSIPSAAGGKDVVSFLLNQHQQIKALFARVRSSTGQARCEAFFELRRLLAVHETAEEEVVHPAARSALPSGASIVDARLKEEGEAKIALAKLESMDVDSAEFNQLFTKFEQDVIAHSEAEEREEFSKLHTVLDRDRLESMRKSVEWAESMAPTRPHPAVGESRMANLLGGPFAAMADRLRDAFHPGNKGSAERPAGVQY